MVWKRTFNKPARGDVMLEPALPLSRIGRSFGFIVPVLEELVATGTTMWLREKQVSKESPMPYMEIRGMKYFP